MKRKEKVYAFIGRAVVYSIIHISAVYGIFFAINNCITVYR